MTRAQAVAVLGLLVLVVWGLMLLGWRRRARRHEDLPALASPPPELGALLTPPSEGVYVSTTTEGDWLDRVTARGLGTRSAAELVVTGNGVGWLRQGAPDVWVPAADVLGVRRTSGMAGKYVERDGIVVVTWRHGGARLDTGFRPRLGADARRLVAAVEELLGSTTDGSTTDGSTTGESSGGHA